MITRLKVDGFKNLVNVDVSFGAFTCIAGANGVGKSNLFDAIRFLSALADQRLVNAAQFVRDGKVGDVRSLFTQGVNGRRSQMRFDVEMIVPRYGEDDLGQEAEASTTFLRYELIIGYSEDERRATHGGLEVLHEVLAYINRGDAAKHLPFNYSDKWIASAVQGVQRSPLISTEKDSNGVTRINLHINRALSLDNRKTAGGKASPYIAANLPKTVLSEVSSVEHRTALMARREMQSWRLLQLEPSALRTPSHVLDPVHIGEKGEHLPATLYQLERESVRGGNESGRVYAGVSNRLARLIEDVHAVEIDRDEGLERITLRVRGKGGVAHTARFLSDGTMRFLALATLEQDMRAQGVICLEEPENGIHPSRIPAILELLEGIATDTDYAIAPGMPDNPLRQVIVNTHSPLVVQSVNEGDLLVATPYSDEDGSVYVQFRGLNKTWRANLVEASPQKLNLTVSMGQLLSYLGVPGEYVPPKEVFVDKRSDGSIPRVRKRVRDREDVRDYQRSLFGGEE